jgi:hypothetical protein
MKKLLILLLPLMFLCSCDCYRVVNGKVIDQITKQPLSGVKIHCKDRPADCTISDTAGHFEISRIASGFNCPQLELVFEKDQYQNAETSSTKGENQTIEMIPK